MNTKKIAAVHRGLHLIVVIVMKTVVTG